MPNVNCTVYFREHPTSKIYAVGQAKWRVGSCHLQVLSPLATHLALSVGTNGSEILADLGPRPATCEARISR